jgi:hypothetical protein
MSSFGLFEFGDAQDFEGERFVEGLALAAAELANEVLLELLFGEMHPFAVCGPIDVAGRDLGLSDEGDSFIAKIGETDGIPGRLLFGRLGA